jgi:hypothetical protein
VYVPELHVLHETGQAPNETLLLAIRQKANWNDGTLLAIEMVRSMGMPVGDEVFETVLWAGRFIEAWHPQPFRTVPRHRIKMHLCGNMQAKDSNIRQALLNLFPRTGGGSTPQVGTKKQPGPLFGVSTHVWSALAVAITAAETEER